MNLEKIGKFIASSRKKQNLTQEQLAEKMDVSIQMISNLELGKKAIRPENLVKVCVILGVSTDYILRGIRTHEELSSITKHFSKLSAEDQKIVGKLIERLSR